MDISFMFHVSLFYVSAIVDRQTGAAVAPDNRTLTSPEQSSLTASLASPSSSPTGFGISRFGTCYQIL